MRRFEIPGGKYVVVQCLLKQMVMLLFRAKSDGAIAPLASPVRKDLHQPYQTNDLTAFLFVWHPIFLHGFQIQILIRQQNSKFQEIIA